MIIIKKNTQALILAGGEGTRLKPITEKIPKPMVEINNKPFLEHQLELLAKNEINDVILCVGYLWEQIQDYFGDRYKSNSGALTNLHYAVEPRFLGTGGAIRNAKRYLREHFFVLNGDSYLPIDYQALGRYCIEKDTTGVLTVYENLDSIVNNNIKVKDSYIVEYNKHQPKPDLNGVDAGAAVYK